MHYCVLGNNNITLPLRRLVSQEFLNECSYFLCVCMCVCVHVRVRVCMCVFTPTPLYRGCVYFLYNGDVVGDPLGRCYARFQAHVKFSKCPPTLTLGLIWQRCVCVCVCLYPRHHHHPQHRPGRLPACLPCR